MNSSEGNGFNSEDSTVAEIAFGHGFSLVAELVGKVAAQSGQDEDSDDYEDPYAPPPRKHAKVYKMGGQSQARKKGGREFPSFQFQAGLTARIYPSGDRTANAHEWRRRQFRFLIVDRLCSARVGICGTC
jgi:hypothetical protein